MQASQLSFQNWPQMMIKSLILFNMIGRFKVGFDYPNNFTIFLVISTLITFINMVVGYYQIQIRKDNKLDHLSQRQLHILIADLHYLPQINSNSSLLNFNKDQFKFTDDLLCRLIEQLYQIKQQNLKQYNSGKLDNDKVGIYIGNSMDYCSFMAIIEFIKFVEQNNDMFYIIYPLQGINYLKSIEVMEQNNKEFNQANFLEYLQQQMEDNSDIMQFQFRKINNYLSKNNIYYQCFEQVINDHETPQRFEYSKISQQYFYEFKQNNNSTQNIQNDKNQQSLSVTILEYLCTLSLSLDIISDGYVLFYILQSSNALLILISTLMLFLFLSPLIVTYQIIIQYRLTQQQNNQSIINIILTSPFALISLIRMDVLQNFLIIFIQPLFGLFKLNINNVIRRLYRNVLGIKVNDYEIGKIRRVRQIIQVAYVNVSNILLQSLLLNINLNKHLYILPQVNAKQIQLTQNVIWISITISIINTLLNLFFLYIEAKAHKSTMREYITMCLIGQIQYAPFLNEKSEIDYSSGLSSQCCQINYQFRIQFGDSQVSAILKKIRQVKSEKEPLIINFGFSISQVSGSKLLELLIESQGRAIILFPSISNYPHMHLPFIKLINRSDFQQTIKRSLTNKNRQLLQVMGEIISIYRLKQYNINPTIFTQSFEKLQSQYNLFQDYIFETLKLLEDGNGQDNYLIDYIKQNKEQFEHLDEQVLIDHFKDDAIIQRVYFTVAKKHDQNVNFPILQKGIYFTQDYFNDLLDYFIKSNQDPNSMSQYQQQIYKAIKLKYDQMLENDKELKDVLNEYTNLFTVKDKYALVRGYIKDGIKGVKEVINM